MLGDKFETVMMLRDGKTSFQDWIRARRAGMGGTDAAALLGHNPYKSVTTLFCEKVVADDPVEAHADSEAAYFGRLLEPVVAEEFQRRTGLVPVPADSLLRSTEWPWMQATLDFWVVDPQSDENRDNDELLMGADSFLECKTTAWYRGRYWKAGTMPPYVEAQVLHYMGVTGADHAWVACLVGGQTFVYFRVDRDDAAVRKLARLEQAFWAHVKNREMPPDPFVLPEDDPLGRQTFRPGETVSMLVLPDHVMDVLRSYWELSEVAELAMARRKELEDRLGDMMYGANVGLLGPEEVLKWEGSRGNRRLVIRHPGETRETRVAFS